MAGQGKQSESKFAKHAESDPALATKTQSEEASKKKSMSISSRLAVFLLFPGAVGSISLTIGIIQQKTNPDYELNIDRDFMYPFVLALCLTMVIGFQTKGFSKDTPEPLVAWPKVKKQRKVVHKHIVKGKEVNFDEDDDEEDDDEEEEEEESDKKNN